MGLVLQAPTDALLPLADATATGATTPAQTAAEADGLFASLLASFSGSLDPQAEPLTGSLPQAATTDLPFAAEKDDHEGADALASLAALTVPVPQFYAPPASANVAGGSGPTAGAAPIAAAGMPDVTEAAAGAVVPSDSAHPTQKFVIQSESAIDPTEAAPLAGAEQAAALAGAEPASPVKAETPAPKPAEPGPPTEAGPTESAAAASVVRSVGNAASDTETGAQGNAFGRKEHDVRPAPRASENGLVHAAANSAVGETRPAQDVAPADAPVPADAPAPSGDLPPQVEHVARTVIERVEQGGGEARIHLDPAGLGEVTIHVHTQGDHVRVDVRAERHEAMQLLRDHTQDLSALLGERGLNLSDVNVGLGRGNGDQAWGQEQSRQDRPAAGEFANILGLGETAALETHNRLRAAYNPDGAMVYRV